VTLSNIVLREEKEAWIREKYIARSFLGGMTPKDPHESFRPKKASEGGSSGHDRKLSIGNSSVSAGDGFPASPRVAGPANWSPKGSPTAPRKESMSSKSWRPWQNVAKKKKSIYIEGYLHLRNKKTWNKKWCVLKQACILYSKARGEANETIIELKTVLSSSLTTGSNLSASSPSLSPTTGSHSPSSSSSGGGGGGKVQWGFDLVTARRTYSFQAENEERYEKWTAAILACMPHLQPQQPPANRPLIKAGSHLGSSSTTNLLKADRPVPRRITSFGEFSHMPLPQRDKSSSCPQDEILSALHRTAGGLHRAQHKQQQLQQQQQLDQHPEEEEVEGQQHAAEQHPEEEQLELHEDEQDDTQLKQQQLLREMECMHEVVQHQPVEQQQQHSDSQGGEESGGADPPGGIPIPQSDNNKAAQKEAESSQSRSWSDHESTFGESNTVEYDPDQGAWVVRELEACEEEEQHEKEADKET